MQVERRVFFDPEEIMEPVRDKVGKTREKGESIDYLTFIADGEPTLYVNLGHEIDQLKPLGIKIAVITNASLIWQDMWGLNLMKADWVSLKIDSTREVIWRNINRHYGALQFGCSVPKILKSESGAAFPGRKWRDVPIGDARICEGLQRRIVNRDNAGKWSQ